MVFRIARHAALAVACAAMPGMAFAIDALEECDGPVEFDGRHYELVAQNGVTWATASAAAEGADIEGVDGHLATITSEAEDIFLESLRKCVRQRENSPLLRQAVWVGGFQDPVNGGAGFGWQWVNGEGTFSPSPDPTKPDPYANWLDGEPNDNGGEEQYLTIGHTGDFGWNDERALGNIGGYIIEYDTSSQVSAIQCTVGDGCVTTAGQTLLLPPITNEDATIGVRTYEFTDNPLRCGISGLVLFGGTDPRPDLLIPPYLCGSPRFLVVEVERDGFEVVQGTVLVENEPIEALPGNWYECDGPAGLGLLPPNYDPQQRDVVAWQATDYETMREDSLGGSVDPMFAGALGEYTFECGSSRGLTKNASYFVVGMHINFGVDYGLNSDGVHERFVALTRYKLLLLQEAVVASQPALTVPGQWVSMRAHVRNALKFHDRGDFGDALSSIETFLEKVEAATYQPVEGENYGGEHLMRGRNIKFTYEEKVIPFAP